VESTISGIVESVTGRETSKGVIHDIVIGTQKVSAWSDSGLGEQAQSLKGQQVEAVVDVVTRGQYTNYNLKSLKLASGTPQTTNGHTSSIPVAASTQDDAAPRIARSVAFEHLHNYVDLVTLEKYDKVPETLDKYAKWIYTGKWQNGTLDEAIAANGAAAVAPATVVEDEVPW
jgi:hypothetical protein